MKPSETLKRAADYIRDNGWWQCGGFDTYVVGAVCASNAIGEVNRDWVEATAARRVLGDVLNFPQHLNSSQVSNKIFDWNDAPDQTPENVILALKLAALHAELDEADEEKRQKLQEEAAHVLVQR